MAYTSRRPRGRKPPHRPLSLKHLLRRRLSKPRLRLPKWPRPPKRLPSRWLPVALGEDQGMVKVVFDAKTGELLGAHMIGAEVTELIQGYAIAMQCETTEHELMETMFPHPTLSEMLHESVLAAYGRAVHI